MFTRKSTMNQGSLLKSKLGAPGCEFGHTCHQVAMSKSNYDTHSRPCTDVQSGIILSCLEYPASSWLKSFTFYWVTLAIPGGLLPIPHQVLTMTHTEVFRLLDETTWFADWRSLNYMNTCTNVLTQTVTWYTILCVQLENHLYTTCIPLVCHLYAACLLLVYYSYRT